MIPHVWTVEQIKALPEFGASNRVGWFYALVEDTFTDEEGDKVVCIVLAEVYPGMGYSLVCQDELDDVSVPMFTQDLRRPGPEASASEGKQP